MHHFWRVVQLIGPTSDALKFAGFPNLPMYMGAKHIYTIYYNEDEVDNAVYARKRNDNFHGLHDLVKEIPDALEHPVAIASSKNRADSVVVLTDLIDENGNPVIVAASFVGNRKMNTSQNYSGQSARKAIDVSIISSAYGKETGQNNIKLENLFNLDTILYMKKV